MEEKDYKERIKQVEEILNNPDYDFPDVDTEKILIQFQNECVKEWYSITQSVMKLLFKLKKEGRLDPEGGNNEKRVFNKALSDFGWNPKQKEELLEANLDSNSPYYRLSELCELDNMITFRNEKKMNVIRKNLESYFGEAKEEDKPICFLDGSSEIYYLYAESKEVSNQAKNDVDEVEPLKRRRESIVQELDKTPFLKNYLPIIESVIDKSIALGYTAGINANTTQTLRKMKECNSK